MPCAKLCNPQCDESFRIFFTSGKYLSGVKDFEKFHSLAWFCGLAVFLDYKHLKTFSRCTFHSWSNGRIGRSHHLKHANNLPSTSTRFPWQRSKMKNEIKNRAWFCETIWNIYYGKWNIMNYFRVQSKREAKEILSCS